MIIFLTDTHTNKAPSKLNKLQKTPLVILHYEFHPSILLHAEQDVTLPQEVTSDFLTLCRRVVNLIKYPLVHGRFNFFECSTPKCTVTYILTL
jgi:hypothetical protein